MKELVKKISGIIRRVRSTVPVEPMDVTKVCAEDERPTNPLIAVDWSQDRQTPVCDDPLTAFIREVVDYMHEPNYAYTFVRLDCDFLHHLEAVTTMANGEKVYTPFRRSVLNADDLLRTIFQSLQAELGEQVMYDGEQISIIPCIAEEEAEANVA